VAEEVLRVIEEIAPRYSEEARIDLREVATRVRWAEASARACDYRGTMIQLIYAGMALGRTSRELVVSDFVRILDAVEKVMEILKKCSK